MSCGDCHQAGRDWRDGRARGFGLVELDRRTPSLWNVGYQHWFGWDGAADSLWMQSLRPILDPREMASSAPRASPGCCARTRRWPAATSAPSANGRATTTRSCWSMPPRRWRRSRRRWSPRARRSTTSATRWSRAIATAALRYPLSAQRGLKIFIGRGNCATCHFGPRFTNGEFGDVGIPFFVRPGEVDSGRHGGIARLKASPFNRLGRHSDDVSGVARRCRFTG